jgi:hypothetical protein
MWPYGLSVCEGGIVISHTAKTWRLIAYIGELASLGCSGTTAAQLLGVSAGLVSVLASKHNIVFHRMESPLRRAIRQGYAAKKAPSEIAYDAGTSVSVVKTLACQMGLTRDASRDPGKHIRGYEIPEHQRAEYRALRLLGLGFKECGYELGILVRPSTLHLTAMPNVNSAHKFSEA